MRRDRRGGRTTDKRTRKRTVSVGTWQRVLLALALVAAASASARADVYRALYTSGGRYLHVEVLDDDLANFEVSAVLPTPQVGDPIYTTPMVAKTD